ncbi:MAG: hypothetical protein D6766_11580 [Verrucomicrobia bacterium]|nr:MAG: hypothetical protein D6766_11580 [Verrucomicrobiota bacterium]
MMTRTARILALGALLLALPAVAAGCASTPSDQTRANTSDPAPVLSLHSDLHSPDEAISFASWDAFAD